jgi:hypothetical protein
MEPDAIGQTSDVGRAMAIASLSDSFELTGSRMSIVEPERELDWKGTPG